MKIVSACAALSVLLLPSLRAASPAVGPPLICHPFAIGDARSLPWTDKGPDKSYDKGRLVQDVAELQKVEKNLLVRMETLRRAALYVKEDRDLAWRLLGRNALMVLEQQTAGSTDALAWFDAGFLVACFGQLGLDLGFRAGVSDGIEGYAYLEKAIAAARTRCDGQVAVMEYAAALATCHSKEGRALYAGHIDRALEGVRSNPLLEKNLATHLEHFGDMHGKQMPKSSEARTAGG
jgi:hypothetical protein